MATTSPARPGNLWAVGNVTALGNDSRWSKVPGPLTGYSGIQLSGVAAVSSHDVWAVGHAGYQSGSSGTVPFTEHWNGTAWKAVPIFDFPAASSGRLSGIVAISPANVWAAGFISTSYGLLPLIEHWNGSQWASTVITNLPPSGDTEFTAIAADSASDIWAVGFQSGSGSDQTLIEHWNGTVWAQSVDANANTSTQLIGVAAIAPDDVWAVGYTSGSTLIERWDGSQWTIVPSPNRPNQDNRLQGIVALSAADIWAVGWFVPEGGSGAFQTLTEHWDGSQWTIVSSPNPSPNCGLYGVAAFAPDDVWAVGYIPLQNEPPIIEHWNGATWSAVANLTTMIGYGQLVAVAPMP